MSRVQSGDVFGGSTGDRSAGDSAWSRRGVRAERRGVAGSGSATRLWPALSRRETGEQPPKGADLFGEWLTGCFARRRLRVRSLLERAEAVLERARGYVHTSDAALKSLALDVGEDVRLQRDDATAVDESAAVVVEVVRRIAGFVLHPEQVAGGLGILGGACVEMATGEGKTVTAVLPAAVNAWAGAARGGVHVVTVNDYLAQRDAEITGPMYAMLGLSVGVVTDATKPGDRRRQYENPIVYGSDKQFIFDHLRDKIVSPVGVSMASHLLDQVLESDRRRLLSEVAPLGGMSDELRGRRGWASAVVQRGLYAAIVDEADSVLVDEAVTPAIIASAEAGEGSPWGGTAHYKTAAELAGLLRKGEDYKVLEQAHRIDLTEAGRRKLAQRAHGLPAFWAGPHRREELVNQALCAVEFHRRDDDYIVRDEKVVIVDRSTGRVLEGRQWQFGLHQAVEAKEGLEITPARVTSARSSYQRFFRRYSRLGGMTGTAWEVRHELWRDYRLPVVRIPTHKPIARRELRDAAFASESAKFEAVADEAARLNAVGRPVLIGTRSVAASERLGELLASRGVDCKVLNAMRESEEAAIVETAGVRGAVTVATNMAGRGTDISLTETSRELGGLVVLATERHEERRVDRQLFGRSGRQGDPGLARAYVSLDDVLVVRHGLRPLRWAVARAPVGLRPMLAGVLWRSAQWSAGRRAAMTRRESVRREAWLDVAFHEPAR